MFGRQVDSHCFNVTPLVFNVHVAHLSPVNVVAQWIRLLPLTGAVWVRTPSPTKTFYYIMLFSFLFRSMLYIEELVKYQHHILIQD